MVSFLLILLLPFLILISIILLCTGENQIFYLQERVGHKNKIFRIFKFATMIKNSSNMGTGSLTLRNDPRILPFGKFLRISKIRFADLRQIYGWSARKIEIYRLSKSMKILKNPAKQNLKNPKEPAKCCKILQSPSKSFKILQNPSKSFKMLRKAPQEEGPNSSTIQPKGETVIAH